MSGRTAYSGRSNRGPSLFIEPYPDKLTESLCARHGLVLIQAKLSEFLSWLSARIGDPPSVSELVVPSIHGLFKSPLSGEEQLSFFTSFELVRPATQNPDGEVSPFYFGRSARWSDLAASLDVPTNDELAFCAKARNQISGHGPKAHILCTVSEPGSGKTTQIRRAAYNLAGEGHVVFCLNLKAVFSPEDTARVLSSADRPVVLVVDGIADHASALRSAINGLKNTKPLVILAADRDYRRDHIDRVLGDLSIEYLTISDWDADSYEKLLERLRKAGLLGNADAVRYPRQFATRLLGDPIAIAACRALNNFRPLDSILKSLWNDATEAARRSFAVAALGEHCHGGGVFYPILESALPNESLADQLQFNCPLPLAYAEEDGDYVLPLSPVIADRVLHMLSREKAPLLLDVFCRLADALSPYVNRRTAIERTAEARLAARLSSAERVARPLLGPLADEFYVKTRESWQWNSRYWEQRALFTQSSDVDAAIQYARHAVAIEAHPFPWTTLASLLARKMEAITTGHKSLYDEIYELLTLVFRAESARSWRPTPHPYAALFHATNAYLEQGGTLPPRQNEWITSRIQIAETIFARDTNLNAAGKRILNKIGGT